MKCPTLLPDESERLQALARYGFEQEQLLKASIRSFKLLPTCLPCLLQR